MARLAADLGLQQRYAEQFAAIATQLGWGAVDAMPDAEFHNVANEVLRANVGELYQKAQALDGTTIDLSETPTLARKFAEAGIGPQELRELAELNVDNVPRGVDPVRFMGRELAKQEKALTDTEFAERYGEPNAERSFRKNR